jgi:Ca2+-binding EF-hand superfamily protein
MDAEQGMAITGMILGGLFEVEDGWAHFDANYANEEGECSNAQFTSLVSVIVDKQSEAIKGFIMGPLSAVYEMAGGENEGQVQKVADRVVKKLPTFIPIFTNALFRFFDADGSGTISKDEIVLAFIGMGSNPALLAPAIFRTLDADGSGSIEAVEIQPFISEIVSAVAKLLVAVVEELENDLKTGLKKGVLKKANKVFDKFAAEGNVPLPMPIDALVGMLADALCSSISEVNQEERFQWRSMAAPLRPMFDAFFARFEAVSEGKPVPLRKAAEIMANTFMGPLTSILTPEMGGAVLPEMLSSFDLPIDPSQLDLTDMLNVTVGALNSYLKSGAMKRVFEALLSFLDVNNDGDISKEELRSLYDGFCAFLDADNADVDAIKAGMTQGFTAFFKILDSDGSGTVDGDDFPRLYDKAVELGLSLAYLLVEFYKTVALAAVMPLLNLAMAMFTNDGSIDMEMIQALMPGGGSD